MDDKKDKKETKKETKEKSRWLEHSKPYTTAQDLTSLKPETKKKASLGDVKPPCDNC